MKRLAALLLLCVCPLQAQRPGINIPFETYVLANGLTVALSTDRTTPTVAVNVWYHVGSKNEMPGRTGFAHLFEHVMFTGSGHVPYGLHDRLTEGAGGSNNGSTSHDITTYYETVPSNCLETMLWIEADRMGFLLDSLDLAKLNAQRDIVKNERRQRIDNQPYGRVYEILSRSIYPASHPYSWPVIGSMDDLSAASEEDVKDFFRLYYAPNNAFLTIVGDFDPPQAKAWVEKHFGDIPQGNRIKRPDVQPVVVASGQRLVLDDRVQVPRLYIQWPTVGSKNDDRFALSVLSAILPGPRTARLTKALVFDEQAAASVSARQDSNEDAGEFMVTITPRPGHSLTDLEVAADTVIERLKREGPTAEEVQKATAGEELSFVRGLESNLGKALQLAAGAAFHGDPVGDVTSMAIRPVIERGLASWRAGGERPTFSYPALPATRPTTIYLIDKPGSAQSTFAIGLPGPPRSTPDYYVLQVMNTTLGGMFQARLNANIREEKGYSYGVGSGFNYGKGPGPFRAGGDIVGDKTDAALVEFMKELRGMLGARPVTEVELRTAKESLVQRLPGTFASVSAINGAITGLWLQGLPDGYYQQYATAIAPITADDVVRVARRYLDLDRLAIVIVGDRKSIEEPLRRTGIAPMVFLDIEGNPVDGP